MFCGILRFLVTAAAVPVCAQLMDGVRAVDMSNAIVLGLLLIRAVPNVSYLRRYVPESRRWMKKSAQVS